MECAEVTERWAAGSFGGLRAPTPQQRSIYLTEPLLQEIEDRLLLLNGGGPTEPPLPPWQWDDRDCDDGEEEGGECEDEDDRSSEAVRRDVCADRDYEDGCERRLADIDCCWLFEASPSATCATCTSGRPTASVTRSTTTGTIAPNHIATRRPT